MALFSLSTLYRRFWSRLQGLMSGSEAPAVKTFLDYFTLFQLRHLACDEVLALYTSTGYPARSLQISHTFFYKEDDLPGHEFLIARVTDAGTEVGFAMAQRTVDLQNPPPNQAPYSAESSEPPSLQAQSANASGFSLSFSPASSQILSQPQLADDTITFSRALRPLLNTRKQAKKLQDYKLSDEEHPDSFLSFIVAVNFVHEHSPMYHILKRQCYWFIGVTFALFSWERAGLLESSEQSFFHTLGHLWGLEIASIQAMEEEARELKAEFDTRKDAVKDQRDAGARLTEEAVTAERRAREEAEAEVAAAKRAREEAEAEVAAARRAIEEQSRALEEAAAMLAAERRAREELEQEFAKVRSEMDQAGATTSPA